MKKRFLILACLTLFCLYIYPTHNVKIGRFEVKSGTRMSIYACGEDPKDWDYIYIASPWLEPIFIERHNLANFLAYTIEAAEKYKLWTEEVNKIGNVSMYHRHIDVPTDVFVLNYQGNSTENIEQMYEYAKSEKLSYDFFVNKVGETLLECNIETTYNSLSFYLDFVGIDDFIYVLQHATERYIKNPNVQTDKLLDILSK